MIIESRPAATPKRCATAASSWYVYRRSENSSGSTPEESARKSRTSCMAGWNSVALA
jgi:hypothetical protein